MEVKPWPCLAQRSPDRVSDADMRIQMDATVLHMPIVTQIHSVVNSCKHEVCSLPC